MIFKWQIQQVLPDKYFCLVENEHLFKSYT